MISTVKSKLPKNLVRARLCEQSFFYFLKEFWGVIIHETPVYNWHIEYQCGMAEEIIDRIIKREDKIFDTIINIPPGTSKSTIWSVMLPVWAWIKDPSIRVLTASHTASLSINLALLSRDIIKSQKFKDYFPDIVLKYDQDNKSHYKNTMGGERYATSVGSTPTGFHAHIILVDDPIDPRGSMSDAYRAEAIKFMDQTLSSRKVNKAVTPTVLVMQRLHANDPTGNWLGKPDKKINHICLPGELSADVKPIELKDKYIDGLLDPVRMSRKVLDDMRLDMGSYGYAGQVMQTPSPLDGGIWQKWLKPVHKSVIPINLTNHGTDWDLAYTAKDTNSASAYVTAGKSGNDMYITDLGFAWLEFPHLIEYMKLRTFPHYIENKACFVAGTLVRTQSGLIPIEAINKNDKVLSLNESTGKMEFKRVLNTFSFSCLQYSSELCIFELKNGKTIKCTPNHEFYIKGNWVESGRIAERVLAMGRGFGEKICGIEHGPDNDNEMENKDGIPGLEPCHYESGKRQKWVSTNNVEDKRKGIYKKNAQGNSQYFYSEPGKQARGKSYKCYTGRQPYRKSRMGYEGRKPTTFGKIRVERRVQERSYSHEFGKRFEGSQCSFERANGKGNTRKVHSIRLYKKNVGRRIWDKYTFNNRLHTPRLEAREINYDEILNAKIIPREEYVYDIEVEDNHNFCITSENIIVHNSGKSAKQVLTNNGIPAIEVNVTGGDKIARATMATPYAESGLIYIDESLIDKLYFDSKQGILVFPNGENDDLQDALVQSINRLLAKRGWWVV